jgi:arsenate reductase
VSSPVVETTRPATRPVRILVLCTGNSCRSILAEALFRDLGGERISIDSAGSHPAGVVDPRTIQVLDEVAPAHDWARSKPLTEFLGREFDHVITVCDDAAEECPTFPGPAVRTHWSIPDPAGATGTAEEQLAVYRNTYADLRGRITAFLATLDG